MDGLKEPELAALYVPKGSWFRAARNVGKVILRSHREFIRHPAFGDDSSLHLGLLPVPYQGNLSKADVFVIMLNPGLGLSDCQTEEDEGRKRYGNRPPQLHLQPDR